MPRHGFPVRGSSLSRAACQSTIVMPPWAQIHPAQGILSLVHVRGFLRVLLIGHLREGLDLKMYIHNPTRE